MGSKGNIIVAYFYDMLIIQYTLWIFLFPMKYWCFSVQDPSESLAVIGRYISENYNGAALHPIDFIDITTGQLAAEVMDPNITTITPVNKLHPRDDVLASSSSRLGLFPRQLIMQRDKALFMFLRYVLIIRLVWHWVFGWWSTKLLSFVLSKEEMITGDSDAVYELHILLAFLWVVMQSTYCLLLFFLFIIITIF